MPLGLPKDAFVLAKGCLQADERMRCRDILHLPDLLQKRGTPRPYMKVVCFEYKNRKRDCSIKKRDCAGMAQSLWVFARNPCITMYVVVSYFMMYVVATYFTMTFVVFTVPSLRRVSTMFRPRLSERCWRPSALKKRWLTTLPLLSLMPSMPSGISSLS